MIYRQVEKLEEIIESIVIGQEWDNDVRIVLFVVLKEGLELTDGLTRKIKDQVRAADIAARYGGDEFAIILPDTPRPAAEATAEKLSRAIATGRTNAGPMSENLPLSASFGVACCPDESRSVPEVLQRADGRGAAAKEEEVVGCLG